MIRAATSTISRRKRKVDDITSSDEDEESLISSDESNKEDDVMSELEAFDDSEHEEVCKQLNNAINVVKNTW